MYFSFGVLYLRILKIFATENIIFTGKRIKKLIKIK